MSGCLHFYVMTILRWVAILIGVIARYVGLSSFLRLQPLASFWSTECVIARYVGLSSFLPYPSGTPVFMRVSEALFARIFQNILIIA